LNEYIKAERTKNYYKAAKIKRVETNKVYMQALNKPLIKTPCKLKFTWHRNTKRNADLDNIAFAKKFVLDGISKAGVIPNDNLMHILGLQDEIKYSKNEGVEIEVIECEKKHEFTNKKY
jgi:Holliday junction resolvase RusA-like endonuclease